MYVVRSTLFIMNTCMCCVFVVILCKIYILVFVYETASKVQYAVIEYILCGLLLYGFIEHCYLSS